jgi:hypothetical protein
MRKRWILGVVALGSAVLLGTVTPEALAAPGQGRGRGAEKAAKAEDKRDKKEHKAEKKDEKVDRKHDTAAVIAVDRDGHVRVIRDYARGGSLPPGLAKRESLPPGLRAQLRERGALPPGLQKRLVIVPTSWNRRLPAVPTYYRRYFAGDDLIVVDTRTNLIVAILRDIWG